MAIINSIFVAVTLLSIAGSVTGIIFLLTQRIIYKFTTANFLVNINKIVILTFVIPFFWILGELDQSNEAFLEYDLVVLVQEHSLKALLYEISETINFANVISIIWITGVLAYLLLQTILYFRFNKEIWEKRSEITDELWLTSFQKCALKTKLNNEIIEFSSVTNIVQPCTVGIWNKSILIPESLIGTLTESEIDIVLCHELTHIRKNHVALKVLIFVLSSLNWFNPILHMLRNSLSEWIEISCDEDLTVVESGEDREAYANMLIKLSSAVTEQRKYGKINAITYFGTRKRVKLLKKRIIGIMKKEQNPDQMAKTLTIAGIICAVCLSTIIAKEMDIAMNAAFSNHVAVFDESEIIVEEVTAIDEGYEYIDFDEDLFEKQVAGSTEMDSSISYEIVYMDSSSELLAAPIMTAMCEHQMEKVNIVEHTKNTDGSCVVLMHEGMHCRECVKTVFGGIIYTSSMAECVH